MKRTPWPRVTAGTSSFTVVLAAIIAACVTDGVETVTCQTGLQCPADWLCTPSGNGCYPAGCGDNVVDRSGGELCDDGNTESGDGCSEYCLILENCGDGKPDPGETCDDGNTVSGDGCSKDCQSTETCGDAVVNPGEQCDEGKETATCDDDCTLPRCGDGTPNELFINPTTGLAEYCDDGFDTLGCDADCSPRECSDGLHNTALEEDGTPIEECDDGKNVVSTDACLPGCKRARCGDAHIQEGVEQCDTLGDRVDCDADCTVVACGDGHVNEAAGERCDDGNDSVLDGCPSGAPGLCQPAACGDGFLRLGFEQCEPRPAGNDASTPDDALCDPNCTFSICGDGYTNTAAGEACDDGNQVNTDACPDGIGGTCQPARCGDGFRASGESCDSSGIDTASCDSDCTAPDCGDGHINRAAGEACDVASDSAQCDSNDCTAPQCGDGHRNASAGEGCDDGNRVNTDECPDGIGGTCQVAHCGDGFVHPDGNETCDDGNGVDFDACPRNCRIARCGDGFLYLGVEVCDDNNEDNTDGCPSGLGGTCEPARCGDGFVQARVEGCEITADPNGCEEGGDCLPPGNSNECQCDA